MNGQIWFAIFVIVFLGVYVSLLCYFGGKKK